jgi:hypothetical protein
MSAWLAMALISEGKVDDQFLPRILERSASEVCARYTDVRVDVADLVLLRARPGPASVADSLDLAEENDGAFNVLIVHHDAGSNSERVHREWLEPFATTWTSRDRSEPMVFVVPVRETEAWAMADGDALRGVFGVSWEDRQLGVPSPVRGVEGIQDTKARLRSVRDRMSGSTLDYHSRLGELIRLDALRGVPAFREWEVALEASLPQVIGAAKA